MIRSNKMLLFIILIMGQAFELNAAIVIEVNPSCGSEGFLQYGPMTVEVQIKNTGSQDITIPEQYPALPGLKFSVSGVAGKQVSFYRDSVQRQRIPITIKQNEHYSYICYLTDFFEFYDSGQVQVVWNVSLPTPTKEDESAVNSSSGSFELKIRPNSETETKTELERTLIFLASAKSEKAQLQYISAICSIHRPLVVPFLARLLGSSMLAQRMAVRRLCSDWMDAPSTIGILDQFLDTTSDGDSANLIVQTYITHNRLLKREQTTKLLTSSEIPIRYAGIWYSRQILAQLDIGNLSLIANGSNPELANQANAILEDVTHKGGVSPNTPLPKNQQADKTGSGF